MELTSAVVDDLGYVVRVYRSEEEAITHVASAVARARRDDRPAPAIHAARVRPGTAVGDRVSRAA